MIIRETNKEKERREKVRKRRSGQRHRRQSSGVVRVSENWKQQQQHMMLLKELQNRIQMSHLFGEYFVLA